MSTNSYHIFMFPFSLKSEWNQTKIDEMLKKANWEREQFFYDKGDFASNFSEQGYFYDFCTGAMFDDPTSLNWVLTTYRYPIGDKSEYTININKKGKTKSYNLKVEKIELNVYDEKAAVLSFHLNNDQYKDIQDILYINDFGRRIYPQYLVNKEDDCTINLQATKNAFLADSIYLNVGNRPPFYDDFSSYERKCIPPYTMPRYIKSLLPDEMHECRWLLDDRMYVVSYFSNQDFSDKMKSYGAGGKWLDKQRIEWWWYQYVFMDNDDPTCQDEEMFRDLLKQATYTRWSGYGTFYGISRYSFTILIGADYIGLKRHVKTMYYRMASLVLAQRVLSLYYSREISEISKELDEDKLTNKELHKRVNTLNRDYLRFVNNVYFREVTPQDQGIDLYDMMQRQMNIKRDEEGLSGEVEQLYHYVAMVNDEQRNNEAEKLSIIATLFLVPTLITGIWGMNLREDPPAPIWYSVFTVIALVLAVYIIIQLFKGRRK